MDQCHSERTVQSVASAFPPPFCASAPSTRRRPRLQAGVNAPGSERKNVVLCRGTNVRMDGRTVGRIADVPAWGTSCEEKPVAAPRLARSGQCCAELPGSIHGPRAQSFISRVLELPSASIPRPYAIRPRPPQQINGCMSVLGAVLVPAAWGDVQSSASRSHRIRRESIVHQGG